jgi:hypothetical protein
VWAFIFPTRVIQFLGRLDFGALMVQEAARTYSRRPNFENAMTDTLPDRLSQSSNSPYYNKELLERGIGIRFNGTEKTNVWEYCVSEGWIRVVAGAALDRKGQPMTMLLKGKVEPYFDAAAPTRE